jgi:rhodanese-related sulfurtransferase
VNDGVFEETTIMRVFRWMIPVLVLMVALAACAPAAENEAITLPEMISPVDAQSQLDEDDSVVLLDVRTQQEWDEDGHSPDATLIPLDQLQSRLGELDADEPIMVICRSGNRSAAAVDFLRQNGFSNVADVEGGMRNWAAAGLDVECSVATCGLTP